MKARIKETGEVLKVTGVWFEDGSMVKPDKIAPIIEEGLSIDLEQRRFELTKAAMQGLLSNGVHNKYSSKVIAQMAICQADAVLAEYRKGCEE